MIPRAHRNPKRSAPPPLRPPATAGAAQGARAARPPSPPPVLAADEVGKAAVNPTAVVSQFNAAFSLMSIIPLLTCFYLITVRFFSISILQGLNGVYFLLALVIALLGLLAGHQLIRRIITELVEANEQLSQLTERQAAFVGNVAHEFRSPLAVFKGALDNLADGLYGPLVTDQVEPVAMCQKEVNRLKRLVTDLLDLTRIEAGKLPMAKEPVVLQDILRAVGQLFNGLLRERGLSFSMDLPEGTAIVVGDRDRLQQVFVNLLSNAVKFTHTGGIQIRLTRDAKEFHVEIDDTGEGIAEENLERIFDKFERVGRPEEQEGSGLGLPIARDIIELHGGRIWAESQPGRGSRFIIRLPISAAPPASSGG